MYFAEYVHVATVPTLFVANAFVHNVRESPFPPSELRIAGVYSPSRIEARSHAVAARMVESSRSERQPGHLASQGRRRGRVRWSCLDAFLAKGKLYLPICVSYRALLVKANAHGAEDEIILCPTTARVRAPGGAGDGCFRVYLLCTRLAIGPSKSLAKHTVLRDPITIPSHGQDSLFRVSFSAQAQASFEGKGKKL